MELALAAAAWLTLAASVSPAGERDTDRDGLSDFHETHKHFTDPAKADSDGDGVPDGDWVERREFTYTVHAVLHVMAPFDVATMNDDYQDVRVLEQRADLLEFEVVVYPFNTVAEAIEPDARWSSQPAEMKPFLASGVCSNWDEPMRSKLRKELELAGVELASMDDVAAVKAVSQWLMDWARYEDGFTTFAFEFADGVPLVTERQRSDVEATLQRFGRTLDEQLARELYGKGMFETRTRGSCTSSAIYLSTGLRAVGIPARTIVCVPIVDANDEREVAWTTERLTHRGVRAIVRGAAEQQRGSWTSHTFNEVYVGGRWRRLNYAQLGQNVLDRGFLGLMVHVHTFVDHSQAGLVGWGNRHAHPLHAQLFGGPNPYSCVSLSDQFGPHSKVEDEPLGLSAATIARLYWYDDPARDPGLSTDLGARDGAAHFFAHIASDASADSGDFMEFYRTVDKQFVLRAPERADVPARGIIKYWIDSSKGINDFILRIEPADYARMEPGVAYRLDWTGEAESPAWKVADSATLSRPKGP
jgi:hypothetical protein